MNERLRVLVVDDEEALRTATAAVLSEDFAVTPAASADEALPLLESRDFDVLCTDFHMPGYNGIQLLRRATTVHAFLSGVLVTGYREYLEEREREEVQGLFYLVLKPYQPVELIARVRRAGEASRLKRAMTSLSSELDLRKRER